MRIPNRGYLLLRMTRRERPDAALNQILAHLAELYQLGQILAAQRAAHTNSLNFILTTSQGKFVLRRHNLSEDAVAYEHQVLEHLTRRGFPAPHMMLRPDGRAWTVLDGAVYSMYEFVEGYCPDNFFWWPAAARLNVIAQCGRTLGEYHQAVADLLPSCYKWNAYRPAEHRRWREGDWFRQVLADIRPLLQKPTATDPMDDFARSRIDMIERMLRLEPVVEGCSDLSKLVIHGDYAPWNILFRKGQSPLVLDFNESRLDLKVYDITLATFWYAWRGDRLDRDKALALQKGYCDTGQLHEADISLAGSVFQWIMARSLTERLYAHYLHRSSVAGNPVGMERQCKMCVFAERHSQQLVAGLRVTAG